MRFGANFPHHAVGHRVDDLRQYVRAVESAGLDFLVAVDHVLGADVSSRPGWVGAYTSEDRLHEVCVLFGCLAALTRLELVTGVLVLPQRQTAVVAKQAAEIDLLLDGRFRLGVAVGWNEVEFQALGTDYQTRGARLEEQIEVLRLLWTSDNALYTGRFHTLDRVSINPLPKQRPIPIWMGGASSRNVQVEPQTERVLERIGRLGDGWICGARPSDELKTSWAAVQASAAAAGRDPARLGLQVTAHVRVAEDARALDRAVDAWRQLGVTHVSLALGQRTDPLDTYVALLEAVSRHLPT